MKNYLNKIIVFTALLSACSSTVDKRKIHEVVSSYHRDGILNGVVLVAKNQKIIYRQSFGYANRKDNQILTNKHSFYLASVSKQFTAICIAMLVAEKKIKIDDYLATYFRELAPLVQGVTLHHLLTHTSGIPDYYSFARVGKGFDNANVLQALKTRKKLLFEPGSRYKYSNSNFILLAEIVARVSKQSFSTFVSKRILKPLSMKGTILHDGNHNVLRLKAKRHNKAMAVSDYVFHTVGAGGIYSNVDDLFRLNVSLLNYQLLKEKEIKPFWQPRVTSEYKIPYGYGFYVDKGAQVIFHDGNLRGAHTMNYIDLKNKYMIIILTNKETDKVKEITHKIADLL